MERSEAVSVFLCILSGFLALCLTYQILYHNRELNQLKLRVEVLEKSRNCPEREPVQEASTEAAKARGSLPTHGVVKRSSNNPLNISALLSIAMSRVVQSELKETLGCSVEETLGTECSFPTGPKGEKGERGAHGEKGAMGAQGEMGVQGPKGDAGLPGLVGPPGAQGDTGRLEFRAVDCNWHRMGVCGASCQKVRDTAAFCPPGTYVAGFGVASKVQAARFNKMIYCCTVQQTSERKD